MAKVFVYLRVSTDDKGQDPKNQLRPCEKFIRDHGLKGEVEVFEEHGSAWRRHERPVFNKMLLRAEREGVKHIVVWRFDRVSRRRVDFLGIWTRCSVQGIKLHSVTEQFIETLNKLPSPWDEIMGRFMLELVAWLSEEESRKKSENVRLAFERKKKKGDVEDWGRPSVEVDEGELKLLRRRGYSIREIAKKLKVSKSVVERRLTNKGASSDKGLKTKTREKKREENG